MTVILLMLSYTVTTLLFEQPSNKIESQISHGFHRVIKALLTSNYIKIALKSGSCLLLNI